MKNTAIITIEAYPKGHRSDSVKFEFEATTNDAWETWEEVSRAELRKVYGNKYDDAPLHLVIR